MERAVGAAIRGIRESLAGATVVSSRRRQLGSPITHHYGHPESRLWSAAFDFRSKDLVPDVSPLRRVLTETVARQGSSIIGADKLPPECRSVARRKLTQMEALERGAIVRSLQGNGDETQEAARALGMSPPSIYPQDKRLRHRVTPLRYSAEKHWLTIIIAKHRVPGHLFPHAGRSTPLMWCGRPQPFAATRGAFDRLAFAPSAWAIWGARSWSTTRMSLRIQHT
jgi:hypothetical protein